MIYSSYSKRKKVDKMIIDIHTHVFPDELAPTAMKSLTTGIHGELTPVSDGTLSGLLKNMDDGGIDISVIQPVVTKQSQFRKANEWAAGARSDRIVSFGGLYPHTDDYKRDIDFLVDLGLPGFKLHAEYQDFIVDSDDMLPIYDYAFSRGLVILQHAGVDLAFPPPYKSTPRQFARIAQAMRGGVMIVAHLGGFHQWDTVEEDLAGCGLYLDTSTGFDIYPQDLFLRVVEKHGADKLLFGSDAPWTSAKTEAEQLRAMPLPAEDIEAILGGNAKRILNI
jgi:predicted TIM-barrel fold metal-dependent hydrolase